MLIDVEFGREDHGLIPYNCDRERIETIWCEDWPQTVYCGEKKTKKEKLFRIFIETRGLTFKRNILSTKITQLRYGISIKYKYYNLYK